MAAYSRRRLIRDLGLFSASAALAFPRSPSALAARVGQTAWNPPAPNPNDLYILFTGPWLLSMEGPSVRVVTTDYQKVTHSYSYFDSLHPAAKPPQLSKDRTYILSVQGYSAAPDNSSLLASMVQANQGLIFKSANATFTGSKTPGLRTIVVPRPTWIRPAALLKGVSFQVTPGLTKTSSIAEWPSALLFVYSGWTTASLSIDSDAPSLTLRSGQPTHLEFLICPGPVPCATPGSGDCNSADADAAHAQDYFNDLMGLLNFAQGYSKPTVAIPSCVAGVNPVHVRRGDDPYIGCGELGLAPMCSADVWQPLNMHLPAERRRGNGERAFGLQLVNCAAGGGGVSGGGG